jgi:hypothetical protein
MYIKNFIKAASVLILMLLAWTVSPAAAADISSKPAPTLVPTTGCLPLAAKN